MKNNTEMKERMNSECLRMVPDALEALHDMMTDPNINPIARVQAIGLIVYIKPHARRGVRESLSDKGDRETPFAIMPERSANCKGAKGGH